MKGYELAELLTNINKYRKFFYSKVNGDGFSITDDNRICFFGNVDFETYESKGLIPEEINEIKELGKIPFNFKYVAGNFVLYGLGIKSLEGCPEVVGDLFDCRHNNITSLVGGPKRVDGNYYCDCNKNLSSLVGGPKEVGGIFDCSECKLTSLEGGPKIADDYYIRENEYPIDLKYLPEVLFGLDVCGTEINQIDTNCKIGKIYCEGCSMETIQKLRRYFEPKGTTIIDKFEFTNHVGGE